MRISSLLSLAALCLIVGSLSAVPCAAQSPAAKPKNPVIHEDFKGYGTTELAAQNDALKQACDSLKRQPGFDWSPDANYLRTHNMVQFCAAEEKEFVEEPMLGVMKVVKMQLDITADQVRDIQKLAQQQRMKERQKLSLLVLIGAVCLLSVVGAYLRLEEATKGYFTVKLRLAALAVLMIATGLLLPLIARVVPH